MKTSYDRIRHTIRFAVLVLIGALGSSLQAQNTSYNLNTASILGINNVAYGVGAMPANTQYYNTAIGSGALQANTSGVENTALGHQAMALNANGIQNIAIGTYALYAAGGASSCVAIGNSCLTNNTASSNIAIGARAMLSNTSGAQNTALGFEAMYYNLVGASNTAVGYRALSQNKGTGNTAMGERALAGNINGTYNVGVGMEAIFYGAGSSGNAALGYRALWSTQVYTNNTGLGSFTSLGTLLTSNATAVGANAIVNTNNKVRLGSTTVTKVEGPVAYTVSDGRFKTDVREDDVKGLAFIQKLRPVVYHFDTRAFTEHLTAEMPDSMRQHYLAEDFAPSTAIRQSGFIAQEVEAAAKAVGYDFNGVSAPTHKGDNYSLAYGQFVVPLVKAVQEQQTLIEKQQAQIAAQQAQITELSGLVHKLAGSSPSDKAPVVNTEVASSIQVFPNPSTGRFTLRIPAEWMGVLQVTDLRGRNVLRQTLLPGNPEYQLDLSAQAKGSYLLRLFDGERLLANEKLIVE